MKIYVQNNGFVFTLYLNKKMTKKIFLFFRNIFYGLLGAIGYKILPFILEMLKKC